MGNFQTYQKWYRRKWYSANKDKVRDTNFRRKYGMSLAEYTVLLEKQRGVCAICGGLNANGRWLGVDHNHETGQIRGLLCAACNHGLGNFNDSEARLAAAISYLEQYRQ